MRLNKRRSDVVIIAEMLRIGENGAPKTKMMYNANLSYSQTKRYLHFLTSRGYLNIMGTGNPSLKYHVTERGLSLLKCIDGFIEILGLYDE